MPLLEIAWFETVVAAQRDKNLPPEADKRRVAARRHPEEASRARQPRQPESGAEKPRQR